MAHFNMTKTFLFNSYNISEEEMKKYDEFLNILEESEIHKIIEEETLKDASKGGRTPYNPYKLFATIIYAFSIHSGSLRKIEESMRYDLRFIYLMEQEIPSHVTISKFLNNIIVKRQHELFSKIMKTIINKYQINVDDCFIDGTKLEANSNKYKFVWKPTIFHIKLNEKVKVILNKYFKPIPEKKFFTSLQIGNYCNELELEIIKKGYDLKTLRIGRGHKNPQIVKDYSFLQKSLLKILDYEEKERICGDDRNSFYKTDHDATAMCLKEDYYSGLGSAMHAAYNAQIIVSKGLILDYLITQNRADFYAFIPTLEQFNLDYNSYPKRICADSGYGSYKNYEFLSLNNIENYVKYNYWQQEISGSNCNLYRFDDFGNLICLNNKTARKEKVFNGRHPKKGREYFYIIDNCKMCRHKDICLEKVSNKKAQMRVFEVSEELYRFKEQAKKNLLSVKGIEMRVNRSTQVEGAFGVIKQDMNYDRVRRRGLENVSCEFMLIVLGYNIRKLFRIMDGKAKMDYWVAPEDLEAETPKTFKKKKKKAKISGNTKLKNEYKYKKKKSC